MSAIALLIILLFEVHRHETPLVIQQEIAPFIQQNCQSIPQEKFPCRADAWRYPALNGNALLSPGDGLESPSPQRER